MIMIKTIPQSMQIVIQMQVQMRVQLHPSHGNEDAPAEDNQREEFYPHIALLVILILSSLGERGSDVRKKAQKVRNFWGKE